MMSDDIKQIFTEEKRVRIIWAKLTDESRQKLKSAIDGKQFFTPNYLTDIQSYHHVTLFFNPRPEDIKRISAWAKEGDIVKLTTEKLCHDLKIQAVVISNVTSHGEPIAIPNKIPHITISAALGVSPVESNDMLKNPEHCFPLKIELDAVLEFVK